VLEAIYAAFDHVAPAIDARIEVRRSSGISDYRIFPVTEHGYSLFWYEGDEEFVRVDWGTRRCAAAEIHFHQHFNTRGEPARYLAVAFGGLRCPFSADKRATLMRMDVSVGQGGRQIEHKDEDLRIRKMLEEQLAKNGVESRMGEVLFNVAKA
jgi:hypothetical protein